MNDEPIEEVYFNWLYNKVAFARHPTPSLTFYNLLRILHRTEFVWFLTGDDNRAQDGLDVRSEFLRGSGLQHESNWSHIGCSVFEMLIALTRKAEFETDLTAREWFWIFMENLSLKDLSDSKRNIDRKVDVILETLIWRTYDANGHRGLFPLKHPTDDQRHVEIWYQFYAYLNEHDDIF
jgi:hypothetical protein